MALRYLRQYKNDDILRKRSREVLQVDDRVRSLLDDMSETMNSANGAGLAAVQVGVLRRAVVIENSGELLKLINPVIIDASGEQQGLEGCLSIPGIYGKVKRPEKVAVKALNERGKEVRLEGTGALARALCHEIDHLDGILFIDKIIPGTEINKKDLKKL